MGGMLDGKEVEGKIGEAVAYSVDATKEGKVLVAVEGEVFKVGVQLDLMKLLEDVTKKTEAKWDDAIVAQLKAMLGLIG